MTGPVRDEAEHALASSLVGSDKPARDQAGAKTAESAKKTPK